MTVTKLAHDDFMVVASDTAHRHVEAILQRNAPAGVAIADVTGAMAQINLQGPNSRAILQSLTSRDLSDSAFPFRSACRLSMGFAEPLCTRITYVGELGFELYVPVEQSVHVYQLLLEAGAEHGLQHAGLKALASLRMEKSYRDYGHDVDNTDPILETGLGFTCRPEGGYIGAEAVQRYREANQDSGKLRLAKRVVGVLVKESEPLLYHGEVLWRDGKRVGDVRAASYGHTLGGAVGLALVHGEPYVTPKYLREGDWQVEVAGQRHPVALSLKPLYDPTNLKIKS